jgi:ketosteroid isomerase-like protein
MPEQLDRRLEERVAALEARASRLEDHVAILNLLAMYGPAVDSGQSVAAAQLWTQDGVYDVGGMARVEGQANIAALYDADLHQGLFSQGSAHVTTAPAVVINGDTATAVAHSLVVRRTGDTYEVWRASANHWDLRRTPAGWRITERYNRTLDGSPDSHDTLARAVSG